MQNLSRSDPTSVPAAADDRPPERSTSPDSPAVFAGAIALHQAGRYAEAEAMYQDVLASRPDHVDGLHLLWLLRFQRGEYGEALLLIDRAAAVSPNDATIHDHRGVTLAALKRHEEALASFATALSINPAYADAFYNRGNLLRELSRFEHAIADYDCAIALKPNHADAANNRGTSLRALGRFEEALASFDRAIALKPGAAEFLNNRGNTLLDLKRIDEALTIFNRALAIRPDHVEAHWNRALCRLLVGNYVEGLPDYEWRWRTDTAEPRNFSVPQWHGEAGIAGRTILLHAEQGHGDTLMAARYIRYVIAQGAHVVLEVPQPLFVLFAEIEGLKQIVVTGSALPSFDLHCPLMSLPLAFGTTLATIPTDVPYLRTPTTDAERWRRRLPTSDRPRVGIAWAGNPRFKRDRGRSIGLRPLLPLLARDDVQFFGIQKFLRDGDAEVLRAHPRVVHLGDAIESFADTAAIMSSLDLVISSDTAVAHLAGALGRPTWVLLQFVPDWRWLLDRKDCPWYPSARLFRQPRPNDWAAVVADVADALTRFGR
jgi:tetratricopeptide (TPR) repeat protein